MQPIGPFCGAGSLEAWRRLGRLSAAVLRRLAIRWITAMAQQAATLESSWSRDLFYHGFPSSDRRLRLDALRGRSGNLLQAQQAVR